VSAWSQHLARQILGIPSPLRQWHGMFDPEKLRETVERGAREPWTAPPWYTVRGPLEPYEWPELRRQDRVLRRLIRRNWYTLLTDPKAPRVDRDSGGDGESAKASGAERVRQDASTFDAWKIRIRSEVAAERMREFGVQAEERS
jgi:hypothetical protein